MNNEECLEVYDFLINLLRENNLEWIVEQVEIEIRNGNIVEREIPTLRESHSEQEAFDFREYPQKLKTGRRAKFPVRDEYGPKERLVILIDAIEQGIVNISEIELHVANFFEKEIPGATEISFYPSEDTKKHFQINKQSADIQNQKCKQLSHLLENLRNEI